MSYFVPHKFGTSGQEESHEDLTCRYQIFHGQVRTGYENGDYLHPLEGALLDQRLGSNSSPQASPTLGLIFGSKIICDGGHTLHSWHQLGGDISDISMEHYYMLYRKIRSSSPVCGSTIPERKQGPLVVFVFAAENYH